MTEASGGARPRVIVVDDDPVVRMVACEALEAAGLESSEAEDGDSALAAIAQSPPDLVVLDVEMPGMDGFEVCRALRERPEGAELPVLIATGLSDSIEAAFQAGASDFISKPFDVQILQHRVRFLMRASQTFTRLRQTLGNLSASEARLASAQRLARIGNWEWVPGSAEMVWSTEVYSILGLEPRAGVSNYETFIAAVHEGDRPELEKAMQRAACDGSSWSLDQRVVTLLGAERNVHQRAEMVFGDGGEPQRLVGTIQDITERRRAEDQIHQLAYYDDLTGLPNRRMLHESLAQLLLREDGERVPVALLLLDLDRFRRINETLGHAPGDDVLRAAASRLAKSVRGAERVAAAPGQFESVIARLGGDEFGVVLAGAHTQEEVAQVGRRVLDVFRAPFSLQGQEMVLGASLGIATFPNDGADPEALLRAAEAAMHHAKARGGDNWQFYSHGMNEKAARKLRLENGLRAALKRDQFTLLYQPKLDVRSGLITGAEALVRWSSPELGTVTPGEFIPLAEEIGLVDQIGEWVLRAGCTQTHAWHRAGLPRIQVAINVSSIQVRKPGIVKRIEQILLESGIEPAKLEIEITESALLSDEPEVVEALNAIRAMGVHLALDDFGTGFSSLTHLVRFPIDTLKIDRSFVSAIGTDPQADAIISAVVVMAHRLDITVVAEGVETEEQAALLRNEGCDVLQGFGIGRPMPPDQLAERLRAQSGD